MRNSNKVKTMAYITMKIILIILFIYTFIKMAAINFNYSIVSYHTKGE